MLEGVADTTTDFIFSERIETNSRRQPKRHSTCSTGTAASPNWIVLYAEQDCTPYLTEAIQNKLNQQYAPWKNEIFYVFPRNRSYHTILVLFAPSQLSCHGAVLGCHVTFCLATTCCMVSTVLLVSSKRNPMSCLAMSCLVKSQHSRFFARRRHSPDDVVWWRSVTRYAPVASCTCATQN